MKTLLLMPFAFVAGPDGFAMFAPYLAFALALTHWSWARRRNRARVPAAATTALGSTDRTSLCDGVAFSV